MLLPCGGQIQKALALTLSNVLLRFLSTHIHGTSVPVEEPSTASKAAVSNRSKAAPYSITSSARARSVAGTVRPSALAVLRLIAKINFVGWSTGKSAGFSPFKMRPR